MYDKVKELTDRWQLLCTYDPDTKEIQPLNYSDFHKGKVQRFEHNSAGMLYRGDHDTLGAATSDWGWRIWKYTWDINGNPALIEGPVVAPWDDRAGLGWE